MDTQQRPCRLRGSISRVKWRWCPPLMSKWLYRLSLLPLPLSLSHSSGSNSGTRWLTTCRLQTLLTRAQSVIRQNWSAGMLSALPSTSRKPRLFLVQSCGLSQVKSLAPMCNEQSLISQPKPALSTRLFQKQDTLSWSLPEDLDL